jgi:hypothetical protein
MEAMSPRLYFFRSKGLVTQNSPPRLGSMLTTAGPEPSLTANCTAWASSITVYFWVTLLSVHSTSSFILKYTHGAPLTGDVSTCCVCTWPCVESAPLGLAIARPCAPTCPDGAKGVSPNRPARIFWTMPPRSAITPTRRRIAPIAAMESPHRAPTAPRTAWAGERPPETCPARWIEGAGVVPAGRPVKLPARPSRHKLSHPLRAARA